jgi:hypothetical protein
MLLFVSISAFAATYHYDEQGRLAFVTWDSGTAIALEYDAGGNMADFGFRRINSHGRLYVSIDGIERNETMRLAYNELASLIGVAKEIKEETYLSDTGLNIPPSYAWWAYRPAHETFGREINKAENFIDLCKAYNDSIPSFTPGQSFELTVRIDENIGFGSMVAKLYIPEGLILTGFSHNNSPGMGNNIASPVISTSGGYVLAGWNGRSTNITGNIDLLTFTVTVANNATPGLTEPFTISFENAPKNAAGDVLKMMLPCGSGFGETNVSGGVIIK